MKRNFPLLVLVLLVYIACQRNDFSGVEQIISEVKTEFAPDKRTMLFDIQAQTRGNEVVLTGETMSAEAKQALLDRMDPLGLEFIDSIIVLPQPGLKGSRGVVRLSVCNIRSQPKHSAELATQSTLGTPLKVWKQRGSWYYVQTPDDYLGWLDAGGFQIMDHEMFMDWQAGDKIVVTAQNGYAYEKPSISSAKVSDLLAGNILLRAGESNQGMVSVHFPDKRVGFVQEDDVVPYATFMEKNVPAAEAILTTAKAYLGTPYLWGGTSGKAFDCSGYTKTVFYLNGLILPRDASQQVHVGHDLGTTINPDDWEPGDLLFFGRKATADTKERITHVGIYMGDGKMIHAAGNVKINSLDPKAPDFAQARYDSFVRAKRVLNTSETNKLLLARNAAY